MKRALYLPLLLIMISAVYLYTASGRAVLDDGDALYAHVGQEMVKRGDWVTPYANGVRFLDKPPMMYWLMAVSYRVFGISEFAARLPSAVAVLGTAMLLFFIGRETGGASSGFAAGVSVAFSIGTILFTRTVFPDMIFVFFLTLALISFLWWHSNRENQALSAMVFYGSLAGAILTKGLIGVVFPLVIVAVFLFGMRDWRSLTKFHLGKGILFFLALALPWHIIAARRNPGFLWYFFVNEQLLRFLGRRQPVDYESISVPLFWVLILVWLFPWSAFFPAIRHLIQSPGDGRVETRAIVWMSLSWTLVVLIFFSISSRIEHYALPLLPPLALLVGITISPDNPGGFPGHDGRQRSVGRGFAMLGIAGGLVGAVFLTGVAAWVAGWRADQVLRGAAHHFHAYRHFFAPMFEFPPRILEQLRTPLMWTALALSAGLLCSWLLERHGHRMRAIMALSLTMMVFSLFTSQSLGICEEILSSRQFGQALNRLYRGGDEAIVVGDYETANSLNFYSPANLDVYDGTASVLQWGLRYPDSPARLLSRAELELRWKSPRRVFLLCPNDLVRSLPLEKCYIVLESGDRTLLCNQNIG